MLEDPEILYEINNYQKISREELQLRASREYYFFTK